MRYSIIIPCFNEEENIADLVETLNSTGSEYDIEWIMVENGSRDGTRKQLEKYCLDKKNFKIVYIDNNLGYGFGLINGLKAANGDYVGWLHADLQVSPDCLIDFIKQEEIAEERYIFYKGKRRRRSLINSFFTGGMTVFASILFGTYLYDIGAIPVLFDRDMLGCFEHIPHGFSIETYVYYIAKARHYRIIRHPVDIGKREKGQSSWDKGIASKFKLSWTLMKELIEIRFGQENRQKTCV